MILNVINADYRYEYQIFITFNNGDSLLVDLGDTLQKDSRNIFIPLRDIDYFKTFKIRLNTITWDNEADFAPEFLLKLGKQQSMMHVLHT